MKPISFEKESKIGILNIIISDVKIPESCGHYERVMTNINGNSKELDYIFTSGKKCLKIYKNSTKQMLGKKIGQDVCIALPQNVVDIIENEIKNIKHERKLLKIQHKENILCGIEKIKLDWSEGSILSGWTCYDNEIISILKEFSLIKDVSGWGYLVNRGLTDNLGGEFSYQDLQNYINPIIEAKKERKEKVEKEKSEKISMAIKQAKETGKKVEIERMIVDCEDPNEECNTDILIRWAMPDGMISTTRSHTW